MREQKYLYIHQENPWGKFGAGYSEELVLTGKQRVKLGPNGPYWNFSVLFESCQL